MMHQLNGLSIADGHRLSHVAVIGNAVPRQCGLATYTTHSASALRQAFPQWRVDHYAMDDGAVACYGNDVAATIPQDDVTAYVQMASRIDRSGAEVIWVQHEFGIFGGSAGDYLLALLDHCHQPVLVTLHTVLADPDEDQLRVMRGLAARADHFIVMAHHAAALLADVYEIARHRISVIPHGAPDRAPIPSSVMKERLGLPNVPTVLTFGLLSPGKGLESAICALPKLIDRHPDILYRIVGATHPALRSREGERYRQSLIDLAKQQGVAAHVAFLNAYLDDDDIIDQLQACDIYLTPYLAKDQVTSGTLAYAIAMGRPVVSTPYIHAEEVLADGVAGTLVPFRDPAAIAGALGDLLADPEALERRSAATWQAARHTIWRCNAQAVGKLLARLAATGVTSLRNTVARLDAHAPDIAPLAAMTDDVGIFQHGRLGIADRRHGYCIDDNARALMAVSAMRTGEPALRRRLAHIYAAFVESSWSAGSGWFRNFMAYDRRWLEDIGSQDSNGRALWALGQTAIDSDVQPIRRWAADLFATTLPMADRLTAPRARAFAMLGMAAVARYASGILPIRQRLDDGVAMLREMLATARRPGWTWFEPELAYDNARLPQALIAAAMVTRDRAALADGLAALRWLVDIQTAPAGHFRPVGSESFGRPYQSPERFDQQPLEALAMVDACFTAWQATHDASWTEHAARALAWFHGSNDLGIALVHDREAGCHDGLTRSGLNRNSGAESIIAYEAALMSMAGFDAALPVPAAAQRDTAARAVA